MSLKSNYKIDSCLFYVFYLLFVGFHTTFSLNALGLVWWVSLRIVVWSILKFFEIRVDEKVCENVCKDI